MGGLVTSGKRVLIANRGEVASRIIKAAFKVGLRPIAVYSPEDALSPFVYEAYESFPLENTSDSPYMDREQLIAIAYQARVYAIHPGYGFLSEDSLFAKMVQDAGFCWIGPNHHIIHKLGNKKNARFIAQEAGIPIVPGAEYLASHSVEEARTDCQQIGYPLLIKDPLSGGGRGAIVVTKDKDFAQAWDQVVLFTQRHTGSRYILVEKFLPSVRHVEVQIAGDGQRTVHFYTRECSIQRRKQKIIEEAPCSFVSQSILEQMHQAAVALGDAISYDHLGTVEFLVDKDGNYFFLEMNTRLQVEHAVTEMITGIDLVDLQFKLSFDGVLPYSQDEISMQGHAIESRIYAENPKLNFLPSPGTITMLYFPQHPFIRYDHSIAHGAEISSFYDPMIMKVISFGNTRSSAINEMVQALRRLVVGGVVTNQSFLEGIFLTSEFWSGSFDTMHFEKKAIVKNCLQITKELSSESQRHEEIALCTAFLGSLLEKSNSSVISSASTKCRWKKGLWKKQVTI